MKKINLSAYEIIWFAIFLAVGIVLSIIWGDTLIGFAAFISGILCVLLAAKGSKWNYPIGIINCVTYAWVSYLAGLYGEAMLLMLFYFPMQFVGFYLWGRKTKDDGIVEMQKLSLIKTVFVFTISAVAVIIFGFFLSTLEGQATPYIDSFTSILSIIAAIMMAKRLREFWLVYVVVNIASVIMWAYQLASGNMDAVTMLVMWSAYLVNSVYGAVVWYKSTRSEVNA